MFLESKRVGVMMGGQSAEAEISRRSGQAIYQALQRAGVNVRALDLTEDSYKAVERLIDQEQVDLVFIAMHGPFGEDGALQEILETLCVPYTGSGPQASRLAMDKVASRKVFEAAGLLVPRCRVLTSDAEIVATQSLSFPVFVKPSCQGSSIGTSFVRVFSHMSESLKTAFHYGSEVLVEEFIRGRELTVSIFDGKVLPVIEIISQRTFFDFEAKYDKDMTDYIIPAQLEAGFLERVKRDAVSAYRALGCRHLGRVDMILSENGDIYILEVNAIPGMTPTSLFPKAARSAAISFERLCVEILGLVYSDTPTVLH